MLYTHSLTGRQFTPTGAGAFGSASQAGHWDDGQEGVIWPAEQFRDGSKVWVAA